MLPRNWQQGVQVFYRRRLWDASVGQWLPAAQLASRMRFTIPTMGEPVDYLGAQNWCD